MPIRNKDCPWQQIDLINIWTCNQGDQGLNIKIPDKSETGFIMVAMSNLTSKC